MVPGLVVVAALLLIARVVAGVEIGGLLASLGRWSHRQLVRAHSGRLAALVTLPVLPAVRAGSATAGVATVRRDGVSLVLSLRHGHRGQPGRFVVRSDWLHVAPGHVGHVGYVGHVGHSGQHTERMVAAGNTARYLEKYFGKDSIQSGSHHLKCFYSKMEFRYCQNFMQIFN